MFEGIRKKLSEAIKQAVKREKEEEEQRPVPLEQEEKLEQASELPEEQVEPEAQAFRTQETEKAANEPIKAAPQAANPEAQPEEAEAEEAGSEKETAEEPNAPKGPKISEVAPHASGKVQKAAAEGSAQQSVRISKMTKLKGVFSGMVRLSDSDIERFSDTMMTSLLQSDVSFSTATAFTEDLKEKLKEKMPSKGIEAELVKKVRSSLMDVLNSVGEGVDIFAFIDKKIAGGAKPVKILFLGPNGTGKTTTIGKIAYALKKRGRSAVLSASDTFRAAAIEQTEYHAAKIGVPVVKSKYGADPASVAFDAINYAAAHSIDVVLIDSAGRQETNKNLLAEVSKMVRVTKPDLTIYVGESTSGNAIENQVSEFKKNVNIDGIILTKMDCDAKGGGAISIAHTTGIPIIYLGTGEAYDALLRYSPKYVVDSVLPE